MLLSWDCSEYNSKQLKKELDRRVIWTDIPKWHESKKYLPALMTQQNPGK